MGHHTRPILTIKKKQNLMYLPINLSLLKYLAIVLPMSLRKNSPIPMGRIPGFLSSGINLAAMYGSNRD